MTDKQKQSMKKVCCVNDMPGIGKIALSAMIPILSAKGLDVSSLPTALVSNTLDFGKFEILDTTDYMEKTVDVWNELDFHFDLYYHRFHGQSAADWYRREADTQSGTKGFTGGSRPNHGR